MSKTMSYDAESIRKIKEAGQRFSEIEAPTESAFQDLLEIAQEAGAPKLIKSVEAVIDSYENGFKKTNREMAEKCENDARLWEKINTTYGAM